MARGLAATDSRGSMALAEVVPATARRTAPEWLARLRRDPVAWGAGLWLAAVVLGAALAPWLTHQNPLAGNIAQQYLPLGSPGHLLGTDQQGRDMLTRLLYGGRLTLLMAVAPVAAASVLGTALGLVAGFWGGRTDAMVMRTLDVFYAFPAVVLAIGVSAALGPGLGNVLVSLPVVFLAPVARVAEAAVHRVKALEFFEAARASGAGTGLVLRHHLLPNILPPVLAYAGSLVGISILLATTLGFLGLGPVPPSPEWGAMLRSLEGALYEQPAVAIAPGGAIFLTSLSFNLLGDCVQDALAGR